MFIFLSLCFVYISSVLQADEESKTGMAEDCDKESDETDETDERTR